MKKMVRFICSEVAISAVISRKSRIGICLRGFRSLVETYPVAPEDRYRSNFLCRREILDKIFSTQKDKIVVERF